MAIALPVVVTVGLVLQPLHMLAQQDLQIQAVVEVEVTRV